ncbi:hypothetical protein GCM10009416_47350 [Craurococcus roseus]|uniref:Guanylate cyclase domain-containing protein n=1 Tax=Craurococcus roseus TaxID=77585 RepID=A0ABP3R689_9PROT
MATLTDIDGRDRARPDGAPGNNPGAAEPELVGPGRGEPVAAVVATPAGRRRIPEVVSTGARWRVDAGRRPCGGRPRRRAGTPAAGGAEPRAAAYAYRSHATADGLPLGSLDAGLALPCPECGTLHRPSGEESRAALGVPPPVGRLAAGLQAPPTRLRARDAERRPVSVLFCDVVDSVGLSSRLDLEDYGALILAYRKACADAVTAAGGIVAQYVGDGVMACFGCPTAHEDDPVRAVRAGLGVLGAMRDLNTDLAAEGMPALAVRAAIHTDVVLVGDLGVGTGQEAITIVGEGPNVAARLQQAAEPDTLLVSDATFCAVQGFFECRPLGPQALRGLSRMMGAFAVVGPTGATTRLEASRTLTPLVGRTDELAELRRLWSCTAQGGGRAVVLRGEAGIGKSRLAQELQAQVAASGPLLITCRCGQEHTTNAPWPLAMATQRLPRGPSARFRSLADVVDELLPPRTACRPTLLVVEDAQWADGATLRLLEILIERLPASAALAVFTARPEFDPPWLDHPGVSLLDLHRLREPEASEMLESLVIGKEMPAVVRRETLERSDGVPLFMEELARAAAAPNSGSPPGGGAYGGMLPPHPIPVTLRGLVMSRLDHLGDGKTIAQLCAGLGSCFSQAQVQAAAGVSATVACRLLARLVAEQFLDRDGSGTAATYSFRHTLVREATYQSMLLARRRFGPR